MKTAAYLRVSTTEQTTDNQKNSIENYCNANSWKFPRYYVDEGISGAKHSRPALDQLKKDIKANKVDTLIVWKFDRLARSTSHLLEVLELLQRSQCDFVSVTESVDTTTAAGKMILVFISAVAEFERSLIAERVKAGLDRAKANGTKLGRPRVGFDVNEAITLKQSGLSWSQLAKRMNVSSATLRRVVPPLLKKLDAS